MLTIFFKSQCVYGLRWPWNKFIEKPTLFSKKKLMSWVIYSVVSTQVVFLQCRHLTLCNYCREHINMGFMEHSNHLAIKSKVYAGWFARYGCWAIKNYTGHKLGSICGPLQSMNVESHERFCPRGWLGGEWVATRPFTLTFFKTNHVELLWTLICARTNGWVNSREADCLAYCGHGTYCWNSTP